MTQRDEQHELRLSILAERISPSITHRRSFDGLIDILHEFQSNDRVRDGMLFLPDSVPMATITRSRWLAEITRLLNETHQDVTETELADLREGSVCPSVYASPTFIDFICMAAERLKTILSEGWSDCEHVEADLNGLLQIDLIFLRAGVYGELRTIEVNRTKPKHDRNASKRKQPKSVRQPTADEISEARTIYKANPATKLNDLAKQIGKKFNGCGKDTASAIRDLMVSEGLCKTKSRPRRKNQKSA